MSDLGAVIRGAYASLSPAEARVADLVLGSPDLMVGFTATELATRAGVSKPTVTRFVAKLGLDGFRAFRELARREHRVPAGSPIDLLSRELDVTEGDLEVLLGETLRADTENLRRTFEGLPRERLLEVVEQLATAPQLVFVDYRKNHPLAAYAGTLFNSVRPQVRTLPERGISAVDGLLDLGTDDVVIIFPFRRAQHEHASTSATVQQRGATLVTIGDRFPNPAATRARVHLVCHTDGVGVFDSLTAAMSVVGLLFTATTNRLGADAQQRLTQLEDAHEVFTTFVRTNSGVPPGGGAG